MKVPTKFIIPDTIEGVAGLLTARKWEKAAIVYAWTKPEVTGRPRKDGKSSKTTGLYGIQEFADLGLAGLRSDRTVSNYRNAWVWAIQESLAEPVAPGDQLDLNDLALVDFPPTAGLGYPATTEHEEDYGTEADKAGVSYDAARRAGANKAAVGAAIKADPEVADAAWQALKERQADKRGRFITDRLNAGVSRETIDKPVEPARGAMSDAVDYAVEETDRRERIQEILQLTQSLRNKAQELVNGFGYTGVKEEVDWLLEATNNLTEAQWSLTGFTVQDAEERSRD